MSTETATLASLSLKLLPAILYIAAGHAAKRLFGLKERPVTNLLFFVLIPVVVFKGAYFSEIATFVGTAAASFAFGAACAAAALLFAPWVRAGIPRAMLMCLFGCFNIGWFGIPIVLVVYGDEAARVMTALYVGGTLFGNTVGYALAQGATASASAMARKVLTVPALYGFLAALAMKLLLPQAGPLLQSEAAGTLFSCFSIATSMLGMGLVGMSMVRAGAQARLAGVLRILLARLLATAALAAAFVAVAGWLSIGSALDRQVFLLLPCLPIAANLLVFVNRGGSDAGVVGLSLFLSTLLSFVLLLAVFTLA